ncbi:MAG: sugar transferase [Muribaculaceae bacterium]|nr:sugar transferase [Muribaculaceae bacterium]MDE6027324.1 sugar transferase [Muribaculaceae bacterium]
MFKRRNQTLRGAYVVSDFIMTSLAFFFINILRYYILNNGSGIEGLLSYLSYPKLLWEQALVPFVLMITYLLSGYYNNPFPRSRLSEFFVTSASALVNTFIIFMTMLVNDPTPRRRTEYLLIALSFLVLLACTYAGRLLITSLAVRAARKSKLVNKTVIIGNSEHARKAADNILAAKSLYENRISAFVALEGEERNDHKYRGIPILKQKHLKAFCLSEKVSQLVIAPATASDRVVLQMLDEFIDLEIPIKIAPDDLDYAIAGIRTNDILGETMIDLTTPRLSDFAQNIKRTFDILISAIAFIVLSPILLAVAVWVKLDSDGPVLYSQERVGRHHRPFKIFKFRTMRTDAEKDGPQLSSDSDSRITKAGRILRKYRIDELPQLFNVLKGDMSIVGPRPEREFFINQIVKKVPYYSLVYQVRPGITSWAMVKFGYASSVDQMVERTKFDMVYINNMSLLLDIKIMIYTIRTILSGAGK